MDIVESYRFESTFNPRQSQRSFRPVRGNETNRNFWKFLGSEKLKPLASYKRLPMEALASRLRGRKEELIIGVDRGVSSLFGLDGFCVMGY